jgi:PKD repeat protein
MKIYLDGTSVYSVSASSLNTNITAGNGTHRLTVKGWDNSGTSYSSTIYFTVGASSGTNKPPIAALSVTPTSGTAPLSVSASTAGSTDPDGSIASVSINFGDGFEFDHNTATVNFALLCDHLLAGK